MRDRETIVVTGAVRVIVETGNATIRAIVGTGNITIRAVVVTGAVATPNIPPDSERTAI